MVTAVAGAVGEALTNAAKHGDATRVVVFVDPGDDGAVLVSVNDDGCGFDPDRTDEGVGLSRSIRGRMDEVGGRVEVDSAPGRGTEVRLHLPDLRGCRPSDVRRVSRRRPRHRTRRRARPVGRRPAGSRPAP